MVINEKGEVYKEMQYFEEDLVIINTEEINNSSQEKNIHSLVKFDKIQSIHDALIMGIRNYFQKLGFSKAILGLSGGIDSAVTFVLAIKALGSENVKGILMPSQFSSEHSVDDAIGLVKNTMANHEIISIAEAYKSIENTLTPQFEGLDFDLTEENIQARIRAIFLMAMSNKFGYILLNTSNKSEAAVGYGTLYGDMCGGLSVLGDVYKTEVYQLAEYINKDQEIIPTNTIKKPPSAELRPDQKDSDSLPDYEILDTILYQYIEQRKGPSELIKIEPYTWAGYMDGSLRTTALEYSNFLIMLINNGKFRGNQVFSENIIETMLEIQDLPGEQSTRMFEPCGRALIWNKVRVENATVYHFNGFGGGFFTEAFFNPETNIAGLFFTTGGFSSFEKLERFTEETVTKMIKCTNRF